jgi:hypothetical protein
MSGELFVPEDFAAPDGLVAGEFWLAPLGPQHNEADYAAWTASIDHIRATPGFPDGNWPREMSLSDNLRDLERHAQDFAERRGPTARFRPILGTRRLRRARPGAPRRGPRVGGKRLAI